MVDSYHPATFWDGYSFLDHPSTSSSTLDSISLFTTAGTGLAGALAAANPGDEIFLAHGTYTGLFTVADANLSLRSLDGAMLVGGVYGADALGTHMAGLNIVPTLTNLTGAASDVIYVASGTSNAALYWITDRAANATPVAVANNPVAGSNGDVLAFSVGPAGATEGFYSYQGTQLKTVNGGNIDASVDAPGGASVSFRFFIDSAWATDGIQQASGIWPVVATTDPNNTLFWPIAEYIDKDRAAELGIVGTTANGAFRFWDSNAPGEWGHYTNVASSGWVNLKYTVAKAAGVLTETWSIDGTTVVTDQTTGTFPDVATALQTIIVNSKNFDNPAGQTYYYDDIKIVGVPDSSEAAYALAHILPA